MLTKALLTGGILSLLAGSIVYYGTEGATATERADTPRLAVNDTELAGAKTEPVLKVEAKDPPKVEPAKVEEKPKTKWLDQYLKSNRDADKVKDSADKTPMETSTAVEESPSGSAYKAEEKSGSAYKAEDSKEETKDEMEKTDSKAESDAQDSAKPSTREDIIRMMREASKRPVKDEKMKDLAEKDGPGSAFLPSEETQDKIDRARGFQTPDMTESLPSRSTDYDRVLSEARKLQVVDMRDQAMLEIVDYAIDRGDMDQAADIVSELSSPELRDTARSRIGKGLAQRGNADAAFAVLDEIEIDELAAPIRLEIIAALMATRDERSMPFLPR